MASICGLLIRLLDVILSPAGSNRIRVKPGDHFSLIGQAFGGLVILELSMRLLSKVARKSILKVINGYINSLYSYGMINLVVDKVVTD